MAQYVSDDKKQEIIRRVREDACKVSDLAREYSVSAKSIYTWLSDGVKGSGASSALEIARLKRETEMLYGLLGKLTAEASRSKK